MKVVVQKEFQRYRPDGTIRVYQPGDSINLTHMSDTIHRLFDEGYMTLAMGDGRRKSLEMCMDATMFMAMQEIQAGGYWRTADPEAERVKREIHEVFNGVLAGKRKLTDYAATVKRWMVVGTNTAIKNNQEAAPNGEEKSA